MAMKKAPAKKAAGKKAASSSAPKRMRSHSMSSDGMDVKSTKSVYMGPGRNLKTGKTFPAYASTKPKKTRYR